MIEAKNISFKYSRSDKFSIDDISLTVEEGMISCLLGANGCGKTTVLKLLYGMLIPKSGNVYYREDKVCPRTLPAYREEVAFTGHTWCDTDLTLKHNVEFLSLLYPSFDQDYYARLLKCAGIEDKSDKLYANLSAGEKVKAEIAFALARRPKLLLMDEPLANLDPVFKTDILEMLQDEVSSSGLGILMSTHLLDEINDITDRIYLLDKGKLSAGGDRFEVLGDNEDTDLRDVVKNMGKEA